MSTVIGQKVTVHIEWMDDRPAEDIEAAAEPQAREGVLRIQRYDYDKPGFTGSTVNYPVANIRSWECVE